MTDPAARLTLLDRRLAGLESLQAERVRRTTALSAEIETLRVEASLLTKVEQTLQALAIKTTAQAATTTDALVTAGLKAIFEDQNLEFRTKVDRARGRTVAEFQLLENGRTFPIADSYGGGVLAVVGVLLRVSVIMILKLRRRLVLDETLAHLSDQYVGAASALLNKLCSRLGFKVIMVTHQPEFAIQADRHYEGRRQGTELILTERKTNSDLTNSKGGG